MPKGKVLWFDIKKGYGFIRCDDERDIFVHSGDSHEDQPLSFQQGGRVEFEIVETPQGLKAINVRKTD